MAGRLYEVHSERIEHFELGALERERDVERKGLRPSLDKDFARLRRGHLYDDSSLLRWQ